MNQGQLAAKLSALGFQKFIPASTTWKSAFVYQFEEQVLVALIHRGGVDLRYYPQFCDQIYLNKAGKLSLHEGYLLRNSYSTAKINVHVHVLKVADDFTYKMVDSSLSNEENRVKPYKASSVPNFCAA